VSKAVVAPAQHATWPRRRATRRTTVARALGFAGVLALCAACAGTRQAIAPPPPHIDVAAQMPALEQQIFAIVQNERRRIDPAAKPLARDAELQGIAERRSADMAARSYIAHTSPDGTTAAGLLMDEDAKYQGLLGENLAVQPIAGDSGIDVQRYARRIVDTWLASSAHRDNLALAGYDRSAVAAAVGGHRIYVIQLFATDPDLFAIPQQDLLPKRSPSNAGGAKVSGKQTQ
jgi:uncharacterized protein YkwD